MLDRHGRIGISLVLGLMTAAPLHAQDPSWGVNVFALGGMNFPLAKLGNNSVDIDQNPFLQVVADVGSSPSLGGGLEFLLLEHDLRIRGQFRTTVGATARGILGVCESGDVALGDVGLCAHQIETDARIMDGSAELVLLLGNPNQRVRPTVSFGLGVHSFQFGTDALDCAEFGTEIDNAYQVCQGSKEILEDPSVNPTLTFGLGLEALRGPAAAFLRANAVTGSYSGGTGQADGGRRMDVVVTGGLAFRIR